MKKLPYESEACEGEAREGCSETQEGEEDRGEDDCEEGSQEEHSQEDRPRDGKALGQAREARLFLQERVMEPVQKTQTIRLADVFFVGPVMMYGGYRLRESGQSMLGGILLALGVLTVTYNGDNYLKNKAK